MKEHSLRLLYSAALIIVLLHGVVCGARWSIEDPSVFPGVWYRIVFDQEGNKSSGDGDGDGWHYYPASDTYRMWFHNGPYDPDRKGRLDYHVYCESVDPDRTTYASIRFVWTTAEWSLSGHSAPPYPGDVPTLGDEYDAMSGKDIFTVDNWRLGLGSKEAETGHTIEAYNPEWTGIEIAGRNAYIFRGAFHDCLPKDDGPGGGDDGGPNVCCRRTTGDCYVIWGGDCVFGYEPLPEGSTCEDCVRATAATLDFGDAPDPTYPTLLANNGARHTVVPGVALGKALDAEADGQPNATATGDDQNGNDADGVVFRSLLTPGVVATIDVTASVQGYLNAWIDFDADGSFDDPGEQVFSDEAVIAGVNELAFAVPAGAVSGATFARFRFSTRGLLGYDGPASDGEVEDYQVRVMRSVGPHASSGVTALIWGQPPAPLDATQPGVLLGSHVISALHRHEILADDFQLQDGQPITGIHWWGSYQGWAEATLPDLVPVAFHVAIWTDEPDAEPGNPNTFNHPGTLVWETYCTHWTWALAGYEGQAGKDGSIAACFQHSCWLSQDEWFEPPVPTTPESTFYWLSIAALYDPKGPKVANEWGWKTRPHLFSETAVRIQQVLPPTDDPLSTPWPPTLGSVWSAGESTQTPGSEPLDMAFQLTTYAPDYGQGPATLPSH